MCVGKPAVLNLNNWAGDLSSLSLTILAVLGLLLCWPSLGDGAESAKDVMGSINSRNDRGIEQGTPGDRKISTEKLEKIEDTLEFIKTTGEKAESRSYFNKMMSLELIHYVKIMVAVLIVIAVAFPLTIWLMSRRRLLGFSGLSTEVTATLRLVEERQAKLANIFKEIQEETDYMHTMSATDLKKLIDQAERYLKQNEKDLEHTGLHTDTRKRS